MLVAMLTSYGRCDKTRSDRSYAERFLREKPTGFDEALRPYFNRVYQSVTYRLISQACHTTSVVDIVEAVRTTQTECSRDDTERSSSILDKKLGKLGF